jgi:hypothetical protein
LLEHDSFVQAYLTALGRRGLARLCQVLRERGESLAPERFASLERMTRSV